MVSNNNAATDNVYEKLEKYNLDYLCARLGRKENKDDLDEIIYNVKYLVKDSVQREITSSTASMLSGGLDSSIIVSLAKKENSNLKTYSINYEDNDKDFTPSSYQGTKDSDFVAIMNNEIPTKHKIITINNLSLYNSLYESMRAREMPGMADVDSSMFCFCKKIKDDEIVVILVKRMSDVGDNFANFWTKKFIIAYSIKSKNAAKKINKYILNFPSTLLISFFL